MNLAALMRLSAVEGVDAATVDLRRNGLHVLALALEHGRVDYDSILDVEERASAALGIDVNIHVWAHQGRQRQAQGFVLFDKAGVFAGTAA